MDNYRLQVRKVREQRGLELVWRAQRGAGKSESRSMKRRSANDKKPKNCAKRARKDSRDASSSTLSLTGPSTQFLRIMKGKIHDLCYQIPQDQPSFNLEMRRNGSHKNAWCKRCVQVAKALLTEDEYQAVEDRLGPTLGNMGKEERLLHMGTPITFFLVSLDADPLSFSALSKVTPFGATTRDLESHLKTCPEGERPAEKPSKTKKSTGETQTTFHFVPTVMYTAAQEQNFAHDFFELIVGTNLAFNWCESPVVRAFFARWMPGIEVPRRKALGTTKIAKEIVKLDITLAEAIKGQAGTLTADGWNSISKKHLIGFVLNVGGKVSPFTELTMTSFQADNRPRA